MAAKEKIGSWLAAWLCPLLLLLAAVAAAPSASALTPGALETRAWEKAAAAFQSCQAQLLQTVGLHQENGSAVYDFAPESLLAAKTGIHKNSLEYIGETHVYRIKGPDGTTFKIGESAQGVRVSDGLSIRAEQQVRRLQRETGETFSSEIRKTFGSKAEARDYERRLIERFRRMYGEDALPGNKSYH